MKQYRWVSTLLLALVLLGIGGVLIFLLVLKYGDRWEEALLRRFRK